MTLIKKVDHFVILLTFVLFLSDGALAENNEPTTHPMIQETAIADSGELGNAQSHATGDTIEKKPGVPFKFKKNDFENSVCFRRCHRVNDFNPSEKTEQQWRMLIEKDGHIIFKEIVWESPDQKEQILNYLLLHAGGSGAEGIGVWH